MTFEVSNINFSYTVMRILERLGIQTSSSFVKICIPEFKQISYFFGIYMACCFYLETIGVS